MDEKYIQKRLLKIAMLLYGKDSEPFSKVKDDVYIFGSKRDKVKNKVDKPVAIFLITGNNYKQL